MEFEGTKVVASDLLGAPPVLPWKVFAKWIGMAEEEDVVRGWIRNGYLPTRKIGTRVLVNVASFTRQLLEQEEF